MNPHYNQQSVDKRFIMQCSFFKHIKLINPQNDSSVCVAHVGLEMWHFFVERFLTSQLENETTT